jgi:O-antigen/teichoic acid export membrane protein
LAVGKVTAPCDRSNFMSYLRLGKWFAGSNVLYSIGSQSVLYLIAGLLGASAVGGFRAVQTVLGPVTLLSVAGDQFMLPRLARRATSIGIPRKLLLLYSSILSLVVLSWAAAIYMFGKGLFSALFGNEFLGFLPILPPLGIAAAAGMFSGTWATRLRSQSLGRSLLRAQLWGSGARVAAVTTGILAVGSLQGAAWGFALGALAHTGALVWYGRRPVEDFQNA